MTEWASFIQESILDFTDRLDVIGHQVNYFDVMGR